MTSGAPVALVILDGWGIAPEGPGNAVSLASTPRIMNQPVSSEIPATAMEKISQNHSALPSWKIW